MLTSYNDWIQFRFVAIINLRIVVMGAQNEMLADGDYLRSLLRDITAVTGYSCELWAVEDYEWNGVGDEGQGKSDEVIYLHAICGGMCTRERTAWRQCCVLWEGIGEGRGESEAEDVARWHLAIGCENRPACCHCRWLRISMRARQTNWEANLYRLYGVRSMHLAVTS